MEVLPRASESLLSVSRTFFEARAAGRSLIGQKGLLRDLAELAEKTADSMPGASMEEAVGCGSVF